MSPIASSPLRSHRRFPAALLALTFLIPITARANGIDLGLLAGYSAAVLIPLLTFNVFAEGLILGPGLRVPQRNIWRVLLRANLTSLAAGIPVKILAAWIDDQRPPTDLAGDLAAYPGSAALGIALYFVVTLVAEFWVIRRWVRSESLAVTRSRLLPMVTLANLLTYAILAPIYYLSTRPLHDIQEFTAGASWAKPPPLPVWFIEDGTSFLCRTETRGGPRRIVVPREVRDFQWHDDTGRVLYRGGDGSLYLHDPLLRTNVLCWATEEPFIMDEVACSPLGRRVAWLAGDPPRLFVREVGATNGPPGVVFPHNPKAIAWTEREDELLIGFPEVRSLARLDAEGVIRELTAATNVQPARVFGRFAAYADGAGYSRRARDGQPGTFYAWDREGTLSIRELPGLGSAVRVLDGDRRIAISENPGILHLGRRRFWNVCLLPEKREALFDDDHATYLLDLDVRRVGCIAAGRDFVLPLPQFTRATGLSSP